MTDRDVVERLLLSLRARARLLAYFLELKSGADPHRPEVLDELRRRCRSTPESLEWAADPSGRDLFGAEWTKDLQAGDRGAHAGHGDSAQASSAASWARDRGVRQAGAEGPLPAEGLLAEARPAPPPAGARGPARAAPRAPPGGGERRVRRGEQPDGRGRVAASPRPGSRRRAGTGRPRTSGPAGRSRSRAAPAGGRPRRGRPASSGDPGRVSAASRSTCGSRPCRRSPPPRRRRPRAVSPSALSRAISASVLRASAVPLRSPLVRAAASRASWARRSPSKSPLIARAIPSTKRASDRQRVEAEGLGLRGGPSRPARRPRPPRRRTPGSRPSGASARAADSRSPSRSARSRAWRPKARACSWSVSWWASCVAAASRRAASGPLLGHVVQRQPGRGPGPRRGGPAAVQPSRLASSRSTAMPRRPASSAQPTAPAMSAASSSNCAWVTIGRPARTGGRSPSARGR